MNNKYENFKRYLNKRYKIMEDSNTSDLPLKYRISKAIVLYLSKNSLGVVWSLDLDDANEYSITYKGYYCGVTKGDWSERNLEQEIAELHKNIRVMTNIKIAINKKK